MASRYTSRVRLHHDNLWTLGSRQGQAMVKYPDGSLYEGGYKSSVGKQACCIVVKARDADAVSGSR